MKRAFVFILVLCLLLTAAPWINIFAQTEDFDKTSEMSMVRLMDLGVFSKAEPENMYMNRNLTREEFATLLIKITLNENKLVTYKNISLFSDVPTDRWSNAYINTAVKLGFMSAMPDQKFHPLGNVTFTEVSVVFGKLLKYDKANLSGVYPQNYLSLILSLGILENIDYRPDAFVTRGQIAAMLNRLLDTRVFGSADSFAESIPDYKTAVVLENNIINPNTDDRRIATDKGVFYLSQGLNVPDLGKKYLFRVANNIIKNVALCNYEYQEISVISMNNGVVVNENGKTFMLPPGIDYYYLGNKMKYDDVRPQIKSYSSILIAYDKKEAVYAALFDPVYSEPDVISDRETGFYLEQKYRNYTVEKGGKFITPSQIEVNDVVYEITDIWNKSGYVLVYDNIVSGKITAILPNKMFPATVEIDGKSFILDDNFPKQKINSSNLIQVGETARLILGRNGTVIDIISDSVSGTEDYAIVLNGFTKNSADSKDFGKSYHYVTLLHSNGSKNTYRTKDPSAYLRGKLVLCKITDIIGEDYDRAELQAIDFNFNGSVTVNKDDRMIGDSFVANGAVIFNIKNTASPEIDASVITFNDLPSGYLMNGKVRYIHKSGDFMDIDVMVVNDVLDECSAYGVVIDKITTFTPLGVTEQVTFMVNGQNMVYVGGETGLYQNTVVKLKLNGNTINNVEYVLTSEAGSNGIQAVDSSRIKINGRVYQYHKDLCIYKYKNNSWRMLEPSDLRKGTDNGYLSLYLDKPRNNGGRVIAIIIR